MAEVSRCGAQPAPASRTTTTPCSVRMKLPGIAAPCEIPARWSRSSRHQASRSGASSCGASRAQIASVDPLPHEHALAVADPVRPQHRRCGHTVTRREHQSERFMLDGAVRVPDVVRFDGIAKRSQSPQAVEPVGVSPVAVSDADVQGFAADGVDAKGATSRIDRHDRGDLEALLGEPGGEHTRIGKAARGTQQQMDRGADHPADREASQDVGGEMSADIQPGDGNQRDQQPCRPARRAAEVRARYGRHRRRNGDVRRRKRQPGRDGTVENHAGDPLVRWTLSNERVDALRNQPGRGAAQKDQFREARPSPEHADGCDDRDGKQRAELHDAHEGRASRCRKLIHQPEEVDLRPTRVPRADCDGGPSEEAEPQQKAQHVAGVTARRRAHRRRRPNSRRRGTDVRLVQRFAHHLPTMHRVPRGGQRPTSRSPQAQMRSNSLRLDSQLVRSSLNPVSATR